ncbi:hypothetical protein B0H14DRAFT_2573655 [Mycena olivaceomarginata]|nr:hypothetical protein B0H14DRAFT_2573655 [Mycena olivaceomarginata]
MSHDSSLRYARTPSSYSCLTCGTNQQGQIYISSSSGAHNVTEIPAYEYLARWDVNNNEWRKVLWTQLFMGMDYYILSIHKNRVPCVLSSRIQELHTRTNPPRIAHGAVLSLSTAHRRGGGGGGMACARD